MDGPAGRHACDRGRVRMRHGTRRDVSPDSNRTALREEVYLLRDVDDGPVIIVRARNALFPAPMKATTGVAPADNLRYR